MAVEIGLRFDLSAWRQGVRNAAELVKKGLGDSILSPFNRAVKRSVDRMRRLFGGATAYIKSALSSAFAPLLGLVATGAILHTIRKTLMGSLAAWRAYSDSVTTLKAALTSVGETNVDAASAGVKRLADQLRLAMGIQGKDTTAAFADFLTRGFDQRQARQLTILAANVAKKTGKPIAEVQRAIADAANGSVDALKTLGVQVSVTGNRVRDAEAAVLAMKAAYGDIGSELANPSERLAAAWNELAVSLGEKISPLIEPMIQGFADLVTGLTQTEEGGKMLEEVALSLVQTIEWLSDSLSKVVAFGGMLKAGWAITKASAKEAVTGFVAWLIETAQKVANTIYNLGRSVILNLMAEATDLLSKHPVLKLASRASGFNSKKFSAELRQKAEAPEESPFITAWKSKFDLDWVAAMGREVAKENAQVVAESMGDWEKAWGDFTDKRVEGSLRTRLEDIRKAGQRVREESDAALSREAAGNRNEGFAGRAAQDVEARKAAAARARAEQQNNARVTKYTDGMQGAGGLQIRFVSTRRDRFGREVRGGGRRR